MGEIVEAIPMEAGEQTIEERARAAVGMALFGEPSSALRENDEENFTQTQGELIKHVANAIRSVLLAQIIANACRPAKLDRANAEA